MAIRHLVSSVVEENAQPNYFLKMDNYGFLCLVEKKDLGKEAE
jgi:hypothetical protein